RQHYTGSWRSGRDSNPRYGFAVYSLSRRAPSTTRPPLRTSLEGRASRRSRCIRQGCSARLRSLVVAPMTPAERLSGQVPSAEAIEAVARRTLAGLPSPFRESLSDIVLLIEEVADPLTARSVGLRDPMQLSGLYQGVPLNQQSVSMSGTLPERVTLYRQPILAEWSAR